MRVAQLQIHHFRSFDKTGPISLGPINVFIGPNNAGKSSVLRALYAIQGPVASADIRIGSETSVLQLTLADIQGIVHWGRTGNAGSGLLQIEIGPNEARQISLRVRDQKYGVAVFLNEEPNHFVVPYFSKRKTATYGEDVGERNAMAVASDFTYLAAKLSRLGNPGFPFHQRYDETCKAILGFTVTAVPSANGQIPGVYLNDGRTMPMEQMGEGVPNIVGLLADLAQSKGKLFLIEEPENDLHPRALKALLDLIVESSGHNQMVVSTHSNIVARHLGATPESKLYYVDSNPGEMPPEATVRSIDPTPTARLEVLRELGYSFSDFDLWDGWLILEESSAERIIRDYLVPWFAPKLSRVRTLSTGGNGGVEPTFDDFNRLIRFTHLEEAYRNSAWVLIDGDDTGQEIIDRLRVRYPSWEADRFTCLSRDQFEKYYPLVFDDRASAALELQGQAQRQAKKALLEEVREWLDADEDRGKTALEESALPVIEHLRRIEGQLLS
jgi:predicted ATPase